MKVLAWDTSSKSAVLAAFELDQDRAHPKLIAEWTLNIEATHSERLLWAVHNLLEASRWKLEEVDVFGVGIGPGSFTGLRIGITTARTLAHLMKKPLVAVSSLALLARPAARWATQSGAATKSESVQVIASVDAAKGELFALWGLASGVEESVILTSDPAQSLWKRGVQEASIAPDLLIDDVLSRSKKSPRGVRFVCIGEGWHRYPEACARIPKKALIETGYPFPDQIQGRSIVTLVWEALARGLEQKPLSVHPNYARASHAELKLLAGELPISPTRSKMKDR